ncbi:TRAP transporter small permease subunit [Pikeienuella piscinae]|uniref:TRAP transporter small permease protein n=1 Tax=Pikeienuella piscinae TaxID=2748098 RepID=A0A7M3T611_9RHOB|nr:TRAP transporter small permease subunit [Pikeienuella piscinae]QIE57442.1 TRAP transporter small permease subunit [Pikeienuella piscinae]
MLYWAERCIGAMSELLGWMGWILILYCMCFGISDVFMRYALNAPSMWIGTSIQAALVLIACVGGAYALKHRAFVKLDLFYAGASPRRKAILDLLTAPFTFLFLGVLIWKGAEAAMLSIKLNQMTPTGVPIPIYPIKTAIPIAGIAVLLVVLQQLAIDIRTLVSGQDPEDDNDENGLP